MLGNKVLTAESRDGKLTPAMVEALLESNKNYSYNPEVLVITQPTELGVLYTCEELKGFCSFAHERGMYVYLDGARLAHAVAALETDLHTMIEETGIDAFSFGGTKAGAMFGEIVVFLREQFGQKLAYSQKQSLQHMDKSKFLGVQMECLLKDGLWLKTAGHANTMAKRLQGKLAEKGVVPYYPVDTNMVFCALTPEQFARVTSVYDLHYWNEAEGVVRFATTHETTEEKIEKLISLL
jgi:threonine aldolase